MMPWHRYLMSHPPQVVIPVNVNSITGTIDGELAAEQCFRELGKHGGRGLKRHHALADAMALRAALHTWM